MEIILPVITGFLYAVGLFFMMHRSFIKLIIGIIIFAHASNLFLFVASDIARNAVPFIDPQVEASFGEMADPLPQAMILTAIVIGLGIQAFAIVLLKRVYYVVETSDLDALNKTDQLTHD
ncbi:NADH-quinone oxidoreductase subunit K [Catalinimonas niigatensis]|uniref:NADH-quinone oxidoreductase subunit K n=1 Tax=Catalinimonas niigatensis TaxID=1397264 RepID=UPI0026650281|nr:NADH-quinone oxidoreductase subunit K [Catalinimonas niigatensis]WPP52156.1 NADH-quinone oxidoreductase subunit K [Catalinimonas niigatensis]